MWYWYLLFFFVTVGAKVVLALATVYLLLPADRRCSSCDEETLAIRPSGAGRLLLRCFFGRVHRRWCPRCGCDGLARRVPPPAAAPLRIYRAAPTRRSPDRSSHEF